MLKIRNKRLVRAALRVQTHWRMRQGYFAYHLKRRAIAVEEERRAAATKLQNLYRGGAARKELAIRQRKQLEMAAIRVQCAWRARQGRYSTMLLRRARAERQKELNAAALKIQSQFRSKSAREYVALQRILKFSPLCDECHSAQCEMFCETCYMKFCRNCCKTIHTLTVALSKHKRYEVQWGPRERTAALMVQSAYRQRLARMELYRRQNAVAIRREHQRMEAAAIKVQARWRCRHAQLGYFLKKQALKFLREESAELIQKVWRGYLRKMLV